MQRQPVDERADETETPIEPFRDGKVHVMSDKCSTCVFRPGNLMHLSPGRLKGMVDHVQETGVPFSCHQTLPYAEGAYVEHYGGAALCHGAVERYGEDSIIMRMAHAHEIIESVEPYGADDDHPDSEHASDDGGTR